MDAMEDFIADNTAQTDKEKKVLHRVNKVNDKAKELSEELRRKVTVKELSEETGISENAIREAIRLSGYKIEEIEENSQENR
jgi:RNA polymerase primary sigma factor